MLTRHRAINIFARAYHELWLQDENVGQEVMIEDLTQSFEDAELKKKEEEEEENKPDPLTQLVTTFCRGAMTECSGALQVHSYNFYTVSYLKSMQTQVLELIATIFVCDTRL